MSLRAVEHAKPGRVRMDQGHAIEIALDLARMPALARIPIDAPLPSHITELMRIAAASPQECRDAAAATGEPVQAVVEAARFYLQQLLFRADADCFRVLGLAPGAPRATARIHMQLLLQWLHPDRNTDLDAVYAQRVLKAWREVSALNGHESSAVHRTSSKKMNGTSPFRLPWIKITAELRGSGIRPFVVWALIFAVVILATAVYFAPEQTAAMLGGR